MKSITYLTIFGTMLLMPFGAFALDVSSSVTAVTVYPNKARETRAGKVNVTQTGEQEIVFGDISRYIDPQSLQVAVPGLNILSVSTRTNYLGKKTDQAQLKSWKDSLDKVQEDRTWLQERIAVAQGELKLYEQNLSVNGDQTALFPKAVEELSALYRTKTLKIREELVKLRKEDKSLGETITKLQSQINTAGGTSQPVQEIVVKAIVNKASALDYNIQYMVSNVSWRPIYDVQAAAMNQPIQVKMRAQITQNTGYDWKNVQLTLSTAQPQTNQKLPDWNTEYINFWEPRVRPTALNEVVVSASRVEEKRSLAKPKYDADGVDDFYDVELVESATAQLYQISRPQNIVSSVNAQLVEISTVDVNGIFEYASVPKKDPGVYLVAKVPDWGSYNLLNGPANIFFDGTYVGQVQLNAQSVQDTLTLSLGKDELVFIDRQELKNVTSKKVIGATKREDKTFEITVKNNKKSALDVVVYDQIPVSKQKDIEVILNESDKAKYNAETGKLEWMVSLKAGESKKVRFSYTIKYPSDKTIVLQ